MSNRQLQDAVKVMSIPKRPRVTTGKARRIAAGRTKIAACGGGFAGFTSGGSGSSVLGSGGNFYSPELSTDFLELPQSLDEIRHFYRFFYKNDPFVGQAIDQQTNIPLSKVRIGTPKANDMDLARKAQRFCERWAERVDLLEHLLYILHDYNLMGEVAVWIEDNNPEIPEEVQFETKVVIDEDGNTREEQIERPDATERLIEWNRKNYKGWTRIQVLPPEQVHIRTFPFTDKILVEFVPDSEMKNIVNEALEGDPAAATIAEDLSPEIITAIVEGENIRLNTDPEAGSFVHYMARKKSQYEVRGTSVLQRCLRTLVYRDKLRQAQTSIASRHMTPIRIVYALDADIADVEELRAQIDLALMDPDYSIITNFEVNWEEMGSNGRLLDLGSEYDLTDRQLYAGLGVTESLLSGEASYAGDRINLEVINTRFMLLRERIQRLVDHYIFKPMCARMGFIEEDEDGNERVIHPRLSFTRLALWDNADTFDALFNLYQKGSLDIDTIYELLNLDGETIKERLLKDMFTVKDATFNEVWRSFYSRIGDELAENSDGIFKVADSVGLNYTKPQEEGGRF